MAQVTKLHNKHRLRYKVYYPDGPRERSRLYRTASDAQQARTIAHQVEAHTAALTYTEQHLAVWANFGLISKADRRALEASLPGGGKNLARAFDEWEATWAAAAAANDARYHKRRKILSIVGARTAIVSLGYADGLRLIQTLRERGLKVVTIRKYIGILRAVIDHQVVTKCLPYNPFATLSPGRTPPDEKTKPVIYTDAEIEKILREARKRDQGNNPLLNRTLELHFLLFFGLGVRRKEASLLRWEYINWKDRYITLPETITKSRKERTIGIGARLYDELVHRKQKRGYILPRHLVESITRAVRKHLHACGIKGRLHDTRHTYTTRLQELGVPPQQVMGRTGHADMSILSHYSHGGFGEVYEDNFTFMQPQNNKNSQKSKKKRKKRREQNRPLVKSR